MLGAYQGDRLLSTLTDVLKQVKAGVRLFDPEDRSIDSMIAFQPTGKALIHAHREGLLEQCEFKKESYRGDLLISAAIVVGGLSYKGDEFLTRETTLKGLLVKHSPSVMQWLFGILAGFVLAVLVSWLVP